MLMRIGIFVLGIFLLVQPARLGAQTTRPHQSTTQPHQSTTQPVLKSTGEMKMHEQFMGLAKKGDINVVFLGDSITDFFRNRGKEVWDQYFAPIKAVNFGISGDRTQHVLWRIDNGELSGFDAKVIVLMLGTNNLSVPNSVRNTNDETIEGLKLVVADIRSHQPKARVLLLAIFPRGKAATNPYRNDLKVVNGALAQLDDGKKIFFMDIGSNFLNLDGSLKTELFIDGNLHPNAAGYKVWADAIIGKVNELMAMP